MTIPNVISACAHFGALELRKEMHLYMMANEFGLDVCKKWMYRKVTFGIL